MQFQVERRWNAVDFWLQSQPKCNEIIAVPCTRPGNPFTDGDTKSTWKTGNERR